MHLSRVAGLLVAGLATVALAACQLVLPSYTGFGTGGGTPAGCVPSTSAVPIADTCGLFVSSSQGNDTTGNGTKGAPYQTLAKGLGAANGQPVYACGETFVVTASVALTAKVDLYGALDCTQGWAYDATKKTQLHADMTTTPIPLTLAGGASGSSVHDFAITAPDATASGRSSIAVLDDHADVTLENVDIVAGAGKDGAAGAKQSLVMTPSSADGQNGADGMCTVSAVIDGGPGGKNTCGGTATDGGNGGRGYADVMGGPGASGKPMTSTNGGAGQAASSCTPGGPGNGGTVGTAGTGARGIGDVSASGYLPPGAMLGGAGSSGQGGGGGGGAHACDMPANTQAGPSGGGGGAGGCGGMPGNPGQSGGSSIGIVALGASLTLTDVTITTGTGGGGGLGGDGQQGAYGGLAGHAINVAACDGGKGGQGGAGGPGGGGAGGHSVGIAIKGGTAPDTSHATFMLGNPRPGGGGGDGDTTSMTKGDPGKACKVLDFTNPTSLMACMM